MVLVNHIFIIVFFYYKLWISLARKNDDFVYIFWYILTTSFLIELKARLTYFVLIIADTFESHYIRMHLFVPDSAHALLLPMLTLAFPFFLQLPRFVSLDATIRQDSSVEYIRMRIDCPFEKILSCSFPILYISYNVAIRICLEIIFLLHFYIFYILRLF